MSKTKELIICIISIVTLVLAITTNVFATDDLNSLLSNNNATAENNQFENIGENTTNTTNNTNNTNTSNNINNTINNITANNTNNNSNATTSIPYTGINYSVIVIIAICGVSAIYAYKKIRDYNIK